jgi:phospholipid-transporting ATPase
MSQKNMVNIIINVIPDEDDATTSGATLEDAGKRVIFINQQQPQKYCNNHISTAKYR